MKFIYIERFINFFINSFSELKLVNTSTLNLQYLLNIYPHKECKTTCSGIDLSAIESFFVEEFIIYF